MHVLTRKIVRFYESKRDFNNLDKNFVKRAKGQKTKLKTEGPNRKSLYI